MKKAMMRLLTIVGVLLCSMHFAEPASAHTGEDAFHFAQDASDEERQEPALQVAHGGHHHCPVAPDLRQTDAQGTEPWTRGLLFVGPTSPLTSRAPPPLLDPPLA